MNLFPTRVGVVGGGRMGVGIAHAFCLAGATVSLIEHSELNASRAMDRVRDAIQTSIIRGTATDSLENLMRRIEVSTELEDLASAELVIEAVPENFALKAATLQKIEAATPPETWLASNTSSLSISELSSVLHRPEIFCGLHFFNPVPSSQLVEIVNGTFTDPRLIQQARTWIDVLSKVPIVVNDSPGFASSRLGVALALEAMRMVEEGVATAHDIDAAMELGYKHPVGPLRTTDLVGTDVRLSIAECLHKELGERFSPPKILKDMVRDGELGRKTGGGFYDW